ncbi:Translocation and assembly module subunit TamB [Methylophilaceae bacterium]|nr:Translocation and assembly module subunit TamB [Methylophilaceae bacterium]
MLARLFIIGMLGALLHTMVNAYATTISIGSSIENVSYDLGTVKLSLENIDSRMRISPTSEGRLLIEDVHARRLTITMAEDDAVAKPASGLPDKIRLPFPIRVKTANIGEIVIVSKGDTRTLSNVAFNLEADDRQLRLELLHASTPWGEAASRLSLENARPYPLKGNFRLTQANAETPYDIDVGLDGNLELLTFQLAGLLKQQDKAMALVVDEESQAAGGTLARIRATGQVGLGSTLPLDMKLHLGELGQPLLNPPQSGRLNLDLAVTGPLGPAPDLQITLQATDSHWHDEPLKLQASARLAGKHLRDILLEASLQENHLLAKGVLGDAETPLDWQATLGNLSQLDNSMAGRLNASGSLRGPLDKLALQIDWQGEQLSHSSNIRIAQITGKAVLSNVRTEPMQADINASKIQVEDNPPFNTDVSLRGTLDEHRIEIRAAGAKDHFHSQISGQLTETGQWLAQIGKLAYQGRKPVEMEGKAAMQYDSAKGFLLENLALRFSDGHIYLDQLLADGKQFATRGRISRLGLAAIPPAIYSLPPHLGGNPLFSGSWDIQAADEVNGKASLDYESGDLLILSGSGDGSSKPLGLKTVTARLEILKNRIALQGGAAGNELGTLNFRADTALSPTASGFALHADAPLKVNADAALKTLYWVPMPHNMPGATMDGQVTLSMQGDGTIGRPNLNGYMKGSSLALALPDAGVSLSNGELDATFSDDKLQITQARFQGGEGSIAASGYLQLEKGQPNLVMDWRAENFTVISRTDRIMVIEGDLKTALSSNLLDVSGRIEIIRGLIELEPEGKPTLGDDVVVSGQAAEEIEKPLLLKVTGLEIGTGNRSGSEFVLRGRGLDTRLAGTLTLDGMPNQVFRADGIINVSGTYLAYGQVLNIERGQLYFSGPVNNPSLSIRAMRQYLPVLAGVEITGTAQSPSVKLVSIPDVPDSDKLSWLVLGHGIDQAGRDQFAMLSLAAGAILSQGQSVPLQTRLARAAGLDSFNVSGSNAETSRISLGKRLSSNLYLSYEKEFTGLLNVARLTYDLTKRWSIRTQAGSESAVDVLYTFSFR